MRQRRDSDASSNPRTSTTTPRKERRAQYFKDVVQERERGPAVQEASGIRQTRRDDGQANYPLWAPTPSDRRQRAGDGGLKTAPADRPRPGPFGSLNQRTARLPTSRSRAWASGNRGDKSEKPRRDDSVRSVRDTRSTKEKGGRDAGGFHSLKMQQALATVSYGARNQTKAKIDDIESFEDFPLLESVQEALSKDTLKGLTDIAPTPIQKLAIPAILGMGESRRRRQAAEGEGMKQYLLAAETGSGKTLAYLLPAIDAMKRAEAEEKRIQEAMQARKEEEEKERLANNMFEVAPPEETPTSTIGRPKVIVLVPTAELVEQVGVVAKSLSHVVKFRAASISSNYSQAIIRSRLYSNLDVLVCTPHLLASISESEANILSNVSTLVIDEADSLLDRSFSPTTSIIIDKATPSLKQLVLCSATIPRRLDNYLQERFPNIRRLTTPNLHAVPRRVQLGIVDVEKDPYRGSKDLACADVIWKIGSSATEHVGEDEKEKVSTKRLLVFVNEREKSVELAGYLASKGVDAVALNRDLDTRAQTDLLAQFCSTATNVQVDDTSMKHARKASKKPSRVLQNTKVLVATDIASRGIDTTAVRHVILYDVPHTSIDFLHRLGRTGRMGRRGRGVVLVGKNDRKDVVREIREAMFRGNALI